MERTVGGVGGGGLEVGGLEVGGLKMGDWMLGDWGWGGGQPLVVVITNAWQNLKPFSRLCGFR